MAEELVKSSSSQRSNPRVLRRVRPVPYECCGGVCSFLNSGCFTLCCNGSKTRRRSSVYVRKGSDKEEKEVEEEDRREELTETTKRLIKPKSQDFLTEEDFYAFDRVYDGEESDESPRKQYYVQEIDIELYETPCEKDEEEDHPPLEETNLDKDDEVSISTDATSVSGGDGSAKKKKKKNKIMKILKMGKLKKKNKDGTSVTSSAASLACSEISGETGDAQNLELESTIIERSEASQGSNTEPIKDEVSRDETDHFTEPNSNEKGGPIVRRLQSIFASIRHKKGKKNVDTSEQTDNTNEGHVFKIAKIIPLGSGTPSKSDNEKPPQPELEIDLRSKPFWKTFSKKDKKKKKGKPASDQEIIDGINPESIENNSDKPTAEQDDKIEVGTDATTIDDVNKAVEEPSNTETKKRTLFSTLKFTKKEDEQNSQQGNCLFSACVNSNLKPETGRKLSSDSIEVKTIADEDLESDGQTIKIVRNDFFPDEVHIADDQLSGCGTDVVDGMDYVEEESVEVKETGENVSAITAEEETDSYKGTENHQEISEDERVEGNAQLEDGPEKKYGVFEKEDFSESLHTLVDETDDNHILLAPTSALIDTTLVNDVASEKYNQLKSEENNLAEGTFRTSCSLSIEASEEYMKKLTEEITSSEQEPKTNVEELIEKTEVVVIEEKVIEGSEVEEELIVETIVTELMTENIQSSSDTLTESRINVSLAEGSTETLKAVDKESMASSWIDVANVDDLSESKFNYIYKTTLRGVKTGAAALVEEPSENDVEIVSSNDHFGCPNGTGCPENKDNEADSKTLEHSCEQCGKSIQEDVQEEPASEQEKEAKCICTTLTKPRQSLTEIEEGSVKSKVEAFNQSKNPIMFPSANVEIVKKDDVTISEAHSSPTLGSKSKSATPSPIAVKSRSGTLSSTNSEWQHAEEDIDRMIHSRGSLSGLGLRSDSMASVYSGAGEGRYGTVAVRGQVEFGLQYNYKAGALEINVKQCKDLAPVDTKRNRSDPYVKVYLLPDKSKSGKRKTKVKKHTLNPVFDENLKFQISLNGLETRTLWLTVWHSDMFGRNDFLGEVMMTLENKVFDDPAPVWYNLQERTEPFDDTISFKGDIIVCLKFVPPDMTVQKKGKRSRGTLHVLVKEAKYLTAYKANGTSDPFCKSYLLPDKGRNSKQKTPVVKKTVNPVWNHTFIYEDVTLQELAERCLELTVWDHDRLASNEFLGGVRFSLGNGKHYGKPAEWMDATGKELTLWKSMLERPNFWVEGCLSLRPSLEAIRTS